MSPRRGDRHRGPPHPRSTIPEHVLVMTMRPLITATPASGVAEAESDPRDPPKEQGDERDRHAAEREEGGKVE